MSEETKDAPPAPKLQFTKETIERQIQQTTQDLSYFQNETQRAIGLIRYLQTIKDKFDLPDAPKPPLEVK